VELRNGRYGPFLRDGEESRSLPEGLALDELDDERVRALLAAPKGDEPIGTDEATGLPVYAKNGRYGPYVQLGDADTLPEGTKPKMSSLFKTMSPSDITLEEALALLSLPRTVGTDPATAEEIVALNGRYGPYLKRGSETRSLATEEELFTTTVEEAVRLLAEPKRRGRATASAPLRELGRDPVTGKPMVVRSGRYGPYVTDGETNASLRERGGDTGADLTDERAADVLQARRDAGPSTRGRKSAARKAGAKKATAKKAGSKKAGAKKAGSKKAAAKTGTETAPPTGARKRPNPG
ncbi:MAG TPA: topoisomerase C-terminal repeat-containing protein, partial [Acidimicrobiales bacterium]